MSEKVNPSEAIAKVKDLIFDFGGIDGSHHKQWLLNEILKTVLTTEEYNEWLVQYSLDEDGEVSFEWDKGIAP